MFSKEFNERQAKQARKNQVHHLGMMKEAVKFALWSTAALRYRYYLWWAVCECEYKGEVAHEFADWAMRWLDKD